MWKSIIYWFVTGAAIGLGLTTIFSLGIALVLAGAALVLYSIKQVATRNVWAALLGLGLAPALLLTYDNINIAPSIPSSGYGGWLWLVCWAIALLGLILGLSSLMQRHRVS